MDFETLIDSYGSMLWRIASSYERDAAICEELYQEICLAVWQSEGKVSEAESPRAYVARIATNQAVSHVRRELRQPDTAEEQTAGLAEADGTPALDEALDVHQKQQRLLAAVQTLPLNWRMPVTLTLEGFKPQEIAYVMGISANTVSLRLTRAKQALRELMSEQEEKLK